MPRELKKWEIENLSSVIVALEQCASPSIKDNHESVKKILKERGCEFEHIQYGVLEKENEAIVWKDYDTPLFIVRLFKAK